MSLVILLDAGPLGLATNPRASRETLECNEWVEELLASGSQVRVPEIADYEVRRELVRAGKTAGIARLNALKLALGYIPLTTETMLMAAEFWAQARNEGRPTADDKALDGDMILAAQAVLVAGAGDTTVIATTNVGHLSRFTDARPWRSIAGT
jgi:predicted nucleic acid-binding protein